MKTLSLDLKFTWKISKGATSKKENYIICVEENGHKACGEVAGITQKEASAKFVQNDFASIHLESVQTLKDIQNLEVCAPLRFGMESALTHLRAKQENKSVSEYLGLKEKSKIPTSFSLPILPLNEISEFIETYQVTRFPVCKIKVGKNLPVESCLEVAKYFKGPLRVDANEAFTDHQSVLQFLENIKKIPLQFLEQPMPAGFVEEYKKLKKLSPVPIIADESIQDGVLTQEIADQFHGINIKLMKTGGYMKALEQIEKAKSMNLKIMLGCMVETSMAIRSAMTIGHDVDWFDLDGFLFFKDEPFQMVQENQGILSASK